MLLDPPCPSFLSVLTTVVSSSRPSSSIPPHDPPHRGQRQTNDTSSEMIYTKETMLLFVSLFLVGSSSLAKASGDQCSGCYPGTSGNCKNTDNSVCYQLAECLPGTEPCGSTPPVSGGGCSNTKDGPGRDEGCETGSNKICVYLNGGLVQGNNDGHHCARCVNSAVPGNANTVDWGCNGKKPVCIGDQHFDLAHNVEGTSCAVCMNSFQSPDACEADDGCPPTKPDCVLWNERDPAIWAPGAKGAARCKNTKEGMLTDQGCPKDYGICVNDDVNFTEPPADGKGDLCSKCSKEICDDKIGCT